MKFSTLDGCKCKWYDVETKRWRLSMQFGYGVAGKFFSRDHLGWSLGGWWGCVMFTRLT